MTEPRQLHTFNLLSGAESLLNTLLRIEKRQLCQNRLQNACRIKATDGVLATH